MSGLRLYGEGEPGARRLAPDGPPLNGEIIRRPRVTGMAWGFRPPVDADPRRPEAFPISADGDGAPSAAVARMPFSAGSPGADAGRPSAGLARKPRPPRVAGDEVGCIRPVRRVLGGADGGDRPRACRRRMPRPAPRLTALLGRGPRPPSSPRGRRLKPHLERWDESRSPVDWRPRNRVRELRLRLTPRGSLDRVGC